MPFIDWMRTCELHYDCAAFIDNPRTAKEKKHMYTRICIILVSIALLLPSLVLADDAAELRKKIFMDQKKLVVMENMEFTEQQGKDFWPIYEKHQQKLFDNGQQFVKIIAAYASVWKNMKDEEGLALWDSYLDAQEQRLELMRAYISDLQKVLPGKQLFRYLQIESKLEAIARYELAQEIPLVQ